MATRLSVYVIAPRMVVTRLCPRIVVTRLSVDVIAPRIVITRLCPRMVVTRLSVDIKAPRMVVTWLFVDGIAPRSVEKRLSGNVVAPQMVVTMLCVDDASFPMVVIRPLAATQMFAQVGEAIEFLLLPLSYRPPMVHILNEYMPRQSFTQMFLINLEREKVFCKCF